MVLRTFGSNLGHRSKFCCIFWVVSSSEMCLCSCLKGWQPFVLRVLFELFGIWTVCSYRAYLDVILIWQARSVMCSHHHSSDSLCFCVLSPHVFPSFELQHSGFFCLFLLASQTFKRRVLWAVFSCMVCEEPSDQVSQDPVWNPNQGEPLTAGALQCSM